MISLQTNLVQHRRAFARELAKFLENTFLQEVGDLQAWWESHVINMLSIGQRGQVRSREIVRLGQLDLHALLRVCDRNWVELAHWCRFSSELRTLMKGVADQRNDYSHEAAEGAIADPANLYRDIDTLFRCASALNFSETLVHSLADARIEALIQLVNSELPHRFISAVAATQESGALEIRGIPISQPTLAKEAKPDDPVARVFGDFRIHGPEESMVTEIQSFRGNPVPATEIPWRVAGPGGLELKVHVCLIDDPENEDELGQVFCESRLNSPAAWDQIVRRLRVGIRRLGDGSLYMDLRIAHPNEEGRATRKTKSLASIERVIGFDFKKELLRVGARAVGTRGELDANPNSRMRECPCVIFDANDIFTPIAAWVAVTVCPLFKRIKN
jgi:hypothetical protein